MRHTLASLSRYPDLTRVGSGSWGRVNPCGQSIAVDFIAHPKHRDLRRQMLAEAITGIVQRCGRFKPARRWRRIIGFNQLEHEIRSRHRRQGSFHPNALDRIGALTQTRRIDQGHGEALEVQRMLNPIARRPSQR